ncbi:hypothetical protein Rin_00014870 [Candidatus Regiella insecticola 5.15]|uniref:Phage-related membrane protein n=2 Tax=Candidatus Regiella insecticola TaxID=138073 RepID=G2H0A7_9ENTR|nr:hypothetical protein Rin_00014870 [Candidatus Regiella insecticola 5.15]
MQLMKSLYTKMLVLFTMCLFSSLALADAADLTTLTNAVDFSKVLTGIMAVAATLITLYAGFAGVKWILRMVRSA